MRKVSSYKCPECGMSYKTLSGWGDHVRRLHPDIVPKGWSDARFFYYTLTGKSEGSCIQCHRPTEWNEATGKYSRYCDDPKCKQEYCKMAKQRMIDKYGKPHLLDDPDKQREMLKAKKNSGEYKFSTGGKVSYVCSYERDFLMTCDIVLGLKATDIISPSPHNYVYMYEGKPHIYIPDFYIPDFNLEIEVKDGGDNPNMHHKIQEVDKVKEKLKDQVMISNPSVNYFKVVNKKYDDFYDFILNCKNAIDDDKLKQVQSKITAIQQPAVEGIVGLYEARKDAMKMADRFTYDFDSIAGPMLTRELEIAFSKYKYYNQLTHAYSYPYMYYRRTGKFIDPAYKNTESLIIEIPLMEVNTQVPIKFKDDLSFDQTRIIDVLNNFERNIMNTIKLREVYSKYPNVSTPYVRWDGSDWMLTVTMNYSMDPANESVNKSKIDDDFKSNGHMKLSSFICTKLTHELRKKYESESKMLKEACEADETHDARIWLDGDKMVAHVCVYTAKEDDPNRDGYNWISSLEVSPEYRGYGLGKQLLDFAVNTMGGTALAVYKDNEIAIKMYKAKGFKFLDKDTIRKMYPDYHSNATWLMVLGKPANESIAMESANSLDWIIEKRMTTNDFREIPDSSDLHLTRDAYFERLKKNPSSLRNTEYYGFYYRKVNELVGILTITSDGVSKCIDLLVVDEPYRKHGIGTQMLDSAVVNHGATWLIVKTTNGPAISIYEKYGFKIVDTYQGKTSMVHRMEYSTAAMESVRSGELQRIRNIIGRKNPEIKNKLKPIVDKYVKQYGINPDRIEITASPQVFYSGEDCEYWELLCMSWFMEKSEIPETHKCFMQIYKEFSKAFKTIEFDKSLDVHLGTILGEGKDCIGLCIDPKSTSANESAESDEFMNFETPKELNTWMQNNISYGEFTKLMSPEELASKKKGSCHDQALFAYTHLKKMGLKPKLLFFIAYKEGESVGGMTHTLCFYKYDNKVCWFETAWDGAKGIRQYSSENEMRVDIFRRYQKLSDFKKFPELEFKVISPEKTGVDLNQYVSDALETVSSDDLTYYGLPEDKKYPMGDPKHVLLAIKFFNYVDEDKEELLASRINARIKEFGIHNINVGDKNRFVKYYEPVEEEVIVDWAPNVPYMTVANEGADPSVQLLDDGFAFAPIKLDNDLYEKYRGTDYYPLYIILMKNISPLGSVIRAYTKEEYSHSAISFDASMDDVYTFGNSVIKKPLGRQKSFGAAHESFRKNSFKFSYSGKTEYSLYVMFFKKDEIDRIKKKVDDIFLHHDEYKYNVEGLISYVFNKPKTDPKKLFCSQFVALIVNAGRNGVINKDPSLYSPVGLTTIRGICHVETGHIEDYDQYRVEKKTHAVFNSLIENKAYEALEHANIMYNA